MQTPPDQALVDEHFARIHRAALVLCGNPWDADDLTQETFLVFSQQYHRFEGRSSLYTWLYGILLNLDRRERRRTDIRKRKLQVVWDEENRDPHQVPASDVRAEVREWKNSLWSRVANLPEGQRQVVVLRFSEGLAYHEISEILECPLGTVKSRMFHGLAALRKALDDEGESAKELPAFPAEDLPHAI